MWTFTVASAWLVLSRSDSSGWVGIITFAFMLPFLVVSPLGGLMADRFDRKGLALATAVGGAAVAAVLAFLGVTGLLEVWHVALLAFAAGSLRAVQEPTIQALIPNQVPRELLLNAITLNAATRHGARFFGLLVAAPLMAVDFVGVNGVLVLSALFYALSAAQLARVRTVSRGERQAAGVRSLGGALGGMVEGLAYIYRHQAIALFIILVAFHCSLTMSFESVFPVFSRDQLGATDGSVVGYLVMAFGAGSLGGTLLLAGVRGERTKGRLLMVTGVVSGLAPAFLALSSQVPVAVLMAGAMGASQSTFMAITNTYIQALAPDRLRGRIASLYILHAGGVMAFANLGYGFLADLFSAPPVLFVTGLLFVAMLASTGLFQPALRRVYRTGEVVA